MTLAVARSLLVPSMQNRTVHILGGTGGLAFFRWFGRFPAPSPSSRPTRSVPWDDMAKAGKITSGALGGSDAVSPQGQRPAAVVELR